MLAPFDYDQVEDGYPVGMEVRVLIYRREDPTTVFEATGVIASRAFMARKGFIGLKQDGSNSYEEYVLKAGEMQSSYEWSQSFLVRSAPPQLAAIVGRRMTAKLSQFRPMNSAQKC